MTDADRIDALETRIAHQDRVIEDLNQTIIAQWKQIDLLTRRVTRLGDRLEAVKEASEQGPQREPPPPHY
jgi:SlyX protein